MMMMTIGTSSTMKSAGMIRKAIGKSIFTGAFCACSSASARRRFRSSTARLRMIWPVETPIVSPCAIERANMRTPGGIDAAEEVLERLDERQAHVLLLQRQAHLAGERLLDLRRREPERLREAETRLERDDDEVDQVRQVLLDLLAALARLRSTMNAGGDPAEDAGGDRRRR